MTIQQIQAIRAVADAIVESIKVAGSNGAPSGVIYAALMSTGISLSQYQSLMAGLVRLGKIRQQGHLYFA